MNSSRKLISIALMWLLTGPPHRNERGLSQSTENAILLAGAVTIATLVITVVYAYVNSNMPK